MGKSWQQEEREKKGKRRRLKVKPQRHAYVNTHSETVV